MLTFPSIEHAQRFARSRNGVGGVGIHAALGFVAVKESEPKWGHTRSDGQRENADLIAIFRPIMRLIIGAHLVDDEASTERIELASIERALTTDPLGMSLAEGKALLAAAQQHMVD